MSNDQLIQDKTVSLSIRCKDGILANPLAAFELDKAQVRIFSSSSEPIEGRILTSLKMIIRIIINCS